MLQIVCECGRIAEVRHRKTGRKLAYQHCTNCGGGVCNAEKAAIIEAQAQENIGVKGEIFKKVPDSVPSSQPEKPVELENKQDDWQPEPEEMPEIVEPDIKKEQQESDTKCPKNGNGLKIVIGVVVASIFGFTAYKVNQG